MNRIVIIEGIVTSLCRNGDDSFSARVESKDSQIVLDLPPEAADQIGAAFREPVRVVVEIGTESSDGGLSPQELRRELASAHHKADEYRRENEALVNSKERLRADITASRCPPFDTEKHITKATVAAWLEADAKRCDRARESFQRDGNKEAAAEMACCARDTREIIARINAHKENP